MPMWRQFSHPNHRLIDASATSIASLASREFRNVRVVIPCANIRPLLWQRHPNTREQHFFTNLGLLKRNNATSWLGCDP